MAWTVSFTTSPLNAQVGDAVATWNAGQPDQFDFTATIPKTMPSEQQFAAGAHAALAAFQAAMHGVGETDDQITAELLALLNS